jgi:hypothetical protein
VHSLLQLLLRSSKWNVFPDAIIHTRITNDERPLRRVLKKFHNYTAVAHTPIIPPVVPLVNDAGSNIGTVDDAREAFLVELASFHLLLKKSVMICEAEARQVEEYQRERQRIGECLILLILFKIYLPVPFRLHRGRAWKVTRPN